MSDDSPKYRYDARMTAEIEPRWQAAWEAQAAFRQPNPGEPGFDEARPKFYCLDMFPYPSGAGLHVGHPEGYTATDILSRYKRMRGFNVLHPMGWDAFGLPAEQYAIQTGVHPAITTKRAIDNFRRQLKRFGFSYDWSREFGTIDPDYYKWTQWIFLQIYGAWFDVEAQRARPIRELIEAFESGQRKPAFNPDAAELSGEEKERVLPAWSALDARTRRRVLDSYRLAYLSQQTVNWCPKLGTALANEEVIDGRSERGGFPVFRKPLKQWLLRITAYGQRLLAGHALIDWPESTIAKQQSWIGHSMGAELAFRLTTKVGTHERLRVFTTRPDTLFGATYMVVAPEHPLIDAVLAAPLPQTDAGSLAAYVQAARNRSDLERQQSKDKSGVFTGVFAENPASGERIPIWTSDYVLMGYGTGAIMAVPAHDERDHEFATRFALPIREVVVRADGAPSDGCFSGEVATSTPKTPSSASMAWRPRSPSSAWWPGSRARGSASASTTPSCATGCSAGSATGASRSRSSTTPRAITTRYARMRCPCCCRSSATTSPRRAMTPSRCSPRPATGSAPAPARPASPIYHRRRRSHARPTPCRAGPDRAGTICATPIHTTRTRPRARRQSGTGSAMASTCTWAAPSTRCCTCSTRASGTRSCTTSAMSARPSRSASFFTRA
jgi:hypothetical protein